MCIRDRHKANAAVMETACDALASLACLADNQAGIAAAGGIEALVRVLGGRPVIEEISSLSQLFAFMEKPKPVKIGKDDDGDACQALASACLALRQLAGLADYQPRIAAAGGVGALMRILQYQAKAAVKKDEDEESHEADDLSLIHI